MAPAAEDATEPLLASSNGPTVQEDAGSDTRKVKQGVWASEFRHILVLSAPAIVQLCTQQALVITNQVRFRQSLRASKSPRCLTAACTIPASTTQRQQEWTSDLLGILCRTEIVASTM